VAVGKRGRAVGTELVGVKVGVGGVVNAGLTGIGNTCGFFVGVRVGGRVGPGVGGLVVGNLVGNLVGEFVGGAGVPTTLAAISMFVALPPSKEERKL